MKVVFAGQTSLVELLHVVLVLPLRPFGAELAFFAPLEFCSLSLSMLHNIHRYKDPNNATADTRAELGISNCFFEATNHFL